MHHVSRIIMGVLPPALSLAPALALAACGGNGPVTAPSATPAASPTGDVLAKIAARPAAQRDGVLFRAIRDAGHECQEIGDVKPQPADPGYMGWLATCDGRNQWLISMDAAGTATVYDARAAAAAAQR